MKLPDTGVLLRIHISELDKHDGKPLYEQIVLKARELNLAGATVLRGIMGYGGSTRRIHTSKILTLSEDLPLVVEIVDTEEKIKTIIDFLDETVTSGLVTMEKVNIITYRGR